MARLRRSDCSRPGFTRRRAGKGWAYYDADGELVVDPEVRCRIEALVIPPAWRDVWICPWPNGHLQAVGTDDAGRRQYRYHDAWRLQRDREKFDHMVEFARRLPAIRAHCAEHLAGDDLSHDRVLAAAVRLLDLGFFRIGTEGYAEEHQTYGLATIRKEHVHLDGDEVVFDYVAKAGKRRIQSIVDPEVGDVVRRLKRRRSGGPELLAWIDAAGDWRDVRSQDINAFIREQADFDCSAKDFRTWSATVIAAVALAVSAAAVSKTARTRAISRMYKEVAGYLGNTPAVCRSSYVDPRVVDHFQAGQTIAAALEDLGADCPPGSPCTQGSVEEALIALLDGDDPLAAAA